MAVVTKYVTFTETDMGKGFITHEDAAAIKFSIVGGNIARLIGEEATDNAWIAKWHCAASDKATYDAAAAAKSSLEKTVDAIKSKVDGIDGLTKTMDTTMKTVNNLCEQIKTDVEKEVTP